MQAGHFDLCEQVLYQLFWYAERFFKIDSLWQNGSSNIIDDTYAKLGQQQLKIMHRRILIQAFIVFLWFAI